MKTALSLLAAVIIGAGFNCPTVLAESANEHKILQPSDLNWQAGPDALPLGVESVVLYGDPSKEGLFALRLKLPKGYHVPPHTHPKPEVVTVISGSGRLGMGETADEANTQTLGAGSFMAMPPGTAHYVYADEDTVIQVNSTGPWDVNYIDPSDDPRQSTN